MKNRIELAKHFAELGFKKGAEIGVFAGHYSDILLKNIPGLELFCIDFWGGYAGYREHGFEGSMGTAHNKAIETLKGRATIIKKLSVEASKDFADESLDFVYIDANHEYKFVKEDIVAWTQKVKKGGIVAGHDYYVSKTGNDGVIRAINEYVKEHGFDLKLTEWDKVTHIDHDDRQPSWYFIK
ncbi:MAG: class I SAM-dependent methyltransferase [Candidatus Paceibacterota bacterium]